MLQADTISVNRSGAKVLDGVSLSLEAGRILAVLGPNGAGKSSLLGALAGDLPVAAGKVLLAGRELSSWDRRELARTRAVVTQENPPAFAHAAAEVAGLGLLPWEGMFSRAEETRWVGEAMAAMDVSALARRPVTELSVGERQRVHLARALVQLAPAAGKARFLLLDEPVASLDPRHQHLLLAALRKLAGEGVAVLAVLHDVNLARRWADDALILRSGRAAAAGPVGGVLVPGVVSEVFEIPARWVGTQEDRWLALGC